MTKHTSYGRLPRSGFEHERKRDALQGRPTRREDKLPTDALRELALHACLFARGARRARGQALELPVQRLRLLTVLERERSPAAAASALVVANVVLGYGASGDRRGQRDGDGKGDLGETHRGGF